MFEINLSMSGLPKTESVVVEKFGRDPFKPRRRDARKSDFYLTEAKNSVLDIQWCVFVPERG